MQLFIAIKNGVDVIGLIFFSCGLLIILQINLLVDLNKSLMIAKRANIH